MGQDRIYDSVGAMFTCEELGYHTTTLKFIPAHNLPTEFQE
jgi:hypothetical protein